ncbi:MAG: PT domain-containing protein [Lachnospiraceae bacterium]|nr:PT domain-containing protein [Lachnospiraceae bacterium]
MKKRLLVLLLVFVFAALTACGKKTEPADNGKDDVTQAVTPDAKEPTAAPTVEPTAEPTADPADNGGEDGGDWRTWRSYTDDYVIGDGFSVCFSMLDDKKGYAAYNSADGSRVGTLAMDNVTGNEIFDTEDINEDGLIDIGVTNGPETSWFAYVAKAWVDGVGGGCFEYVEPADDPDDGILDPPTVDALGNDPSVYDWNYENFTADIIGVNDNDDYCVVTFDIKDQYALASDEVVNASIGDVFSLNGRNVTVTKILSMDEDYNYTVEHDSYEEGCRVIVMPENARDFFSVQALTEETLEDNPEYAEFGFVTFDGGDTFYAYSDWQWDDCYVPVDYVILSGVNFVVTPDTEAYPAYCDRETYGYDFYLPGVEYLRLRDDDDEQERRGIHIYHGVGYQIELERDDEGNPTGELTVLREIYMP